MDFGNFMATFWHSNEQLPAFYKHNLGFKEFSTMGSQAKSLSSRSINIVSQALRYQVAIWMCWRLSLLKIHPVKFHTWQDKP